MQRLRFLVWKEFLELRLNPRLFGVVVVAPIIQLTLLGYAATTDIKDVPLVVADGDRTARSRELVARFEGSTTFNVVSTVTTVAEVSYATYEFQGRRVFAGVPGGACRLCVKELVPST